MQKYLLGLDIGTTGVKAVAVSEQTGKVLKTATSSSYPLNSLQPKWAQQDPQDWVKASVEVMKMILQYFRKQQKETELRAISFSGQMHSLVLLDEKYCVLRPAILWCDTRTTKQCQQIHSHLAQSNILKDVVCNSALQGFTLPKLLWIRENEPQIFKKVAHICLPKDYVRYRLTNQLYQQVSDAAGMLMIDVPKRQWANQILQAFDISPSLLPKIKESTDFCGNLIKSKQTQELFELLPDNSNIPCYAGGADNACAALGNGIVNNGTILASLGTSGVVLTVTDEKPIVDPNLVAHCFCHVSSNKWYNMGVILSAGGAFKWLSELLQLDQEVMCKQAETVGVGSEGIIFLPYICGIRTPNADSNARGTFFGLALKHQKRHMIRSCIEGVAFAMRDALQIVKRMMKEGKDSLDKQADEVVVTGGCVKGKIWRQILADVFGMKVRVIRQGEGPAFGAALLAGIGVGVWKNVQQASKTCKTEAVGDKDGEEDKSNGEDQIVLPNEQRVQKYNKIYKLYQKLYYDLKDDFRLLNQQLGGD